MPAIGPLRKNCAISTNQSIEIISEEKSYPMKSDRTCLQI